MFGKENQKRPELRDAGIKFKHQIPNECSNRWTKPRRSKVFHLVYANDLVVFDADPVHLNGVFFCVLEEVFIRFGFLIAQDKTKLMTFYTEPKYIPHVFEITTGILGDVTDFKYLGYKVSSINSLSFFEHQISAAWAAFNRKKTALTCLKIPIKTQVSLFQSFVVSIVCYSAQAWCLPQSELDKLDVLHRNFLSKWLEEDSRS